MLLLFLLLLPDAGDVIPRQSAGEQGVQAYVSTFRGHIACINQPLVAFVGGVARAAHVAVTTLRHVDDDFAAMVDGVFQVRIVGQVAIAEGGQYHAFG